MSVTLVHCAEDPLAAHCATHLTRRLSSAAVPEGHCEFVDLGGATGWSNRQQVKDLARTRRFHPRGLGGSSAHAYKCVRLATGHGDVLLLSFDRDEEHRIRQGVEEARRTVAEAIPTIVAEAYPEFEAWVIAGHQLLSAHQRDCHRRAVEQLRASGFPFDPLEQPHKLTSDVTGDPRDAKRMLELLLELAGQPAGKPEVSTCLDADLATLRGRGKHTGIVEFLDEISAVVVPLLET